MTEPTQRFVEARGLKFHVDDRGEGAPVIFSSGYSTCIPIWEPQLAALSDRYRVINWDYRGHGQSDAPGDAAAYSSIDVIVEDLVALLDTLKIPRMVACGLSIGQNRPVSWTFRFRPEIRVQRRKLVKTRSHGLNMQRRKEELTHDTAADSV